jgi:hypothetical protein
VVVVATTTKEERVGEGWEKNRLGGDRVKGLLVAGAAATP